MGYDILYKALIMIYIVVTIEEISQTYSDFKSRGKYNFR